MFPIFVPTKGRPDAALIKVLRDEGLSFYLVLEPQDKAKYLKRYPGSNFYILPMNDGGLAYARQCILRTAREMGIDWYWQIDDNITGFVEVVNGKCVDASARDALSGAEALVGRHKRVGLIALEYMQFAWSATKEYQFNGRAYCTVLTSTRTGIDYSVELDAKADVDFMIKHFQKRWRSILVKRWSMKKPPMGKNKKGGQTAMYAANRNSVVAMELKRRWPRFCNLIKKPGGIDVRIDWRYVNSLFGR